jgi:hypothetical protein
MSNLQRRIKAFAITKEDLYQGIASGMPVPAAKTNRL